MELTIHADERIQGRTKLLARDVLSIASSSAGILLGADGQYEYLLFFSPPDRGCKIAVLSQDRSCLVSVWESSYRLPHGLKKVTPGRKKKAREALQSYLFARSATCNVTPFRIFLEVLVNQSIIHREFLGEIPSLQANEWRPVVQAFLPRLKEIAEIAEKAKQKAEGRVRYDLQLFNPIRRACVRTWKLRHEKLLDFIRAAPQ